MIIISRDVGESCMSHIGGRVNKYQHCMIFRHLTGFLRNHGRISKGVQERSSSTNLGEINVVSIDSRLLLSPVYYSFQRLTAEAEGVLRPTGSSSPLIQKSSLRRNNDVFTLVICIPFILLSRFTINRGLSRFRASPMMRP